jgi:hypothetical protein
MQGKVIKMDCNAPKEMHAVVVHPQTTPKVSVESLQAILVGNQRATHRLQGAVVSSISTKDLATIQPIIPNPVPIKDFPLHSEQEGFSFS